VGGRKPQQNQLSCLSRNTNTEAMKLLKQNSYMIDWWNLSCNSNADAGGVVEENPDKIVWFSLSFTNTEAVELLKQNP
jgi:hypothetical protein